MGTSVASPTILKQNSGASKIGTASGDDLQTVLGLLATLASPALTGTPTAPTAAADANTTQIATTAMVQAAIAALVDSAPAELNTINELAAALGDNENYAATITSALALKAALESPEFTGTPTAPTAGAGTDTTQIATTEFVQQEMVVPGWELIETAVCSSDASVDFTLADYDTYFLVFDSVKGGNSPSIRVSDDGGSSFISTGYSWGNIYAGTQTSNSSDDRIILASAGLGINGVLQICGALKVAEKTQVIPNISVIGERWVHEASGFRDAAEVNDAVQFFFNGDTIDSGTISLYGLKSF